MAVAALASLVQRRVVALRSVAAERLVSVRCLLPAVRCLLAAPQLPLVAVVVALTLREALRRVPEARSTNVSHVFSLRTKWMYSRRRRGRSCLRAASRPFSTGDSKVHSVTVPRVPRVPNVVVPGVLEGLQVHGRGRQVCGASDRITHSCRDAPARSRITAIVATGEADTQPSDTFVASR